LIYAGAAVAVGTDLNPGSSPLCSTSEALALSVRLNGQAIRPEKGQRRCTSAL
jgi:imidazolonepropionase